MSLCGCGTDISPKAKFCGICGRAVNGSRSETGTLPGKFHRACFVLLIVWTGLISGLAIPIFLTVATPNRHTSAVLERVVVTGIGRLALLWAAGSVVFALLAIATRPNPSVSWPIATKWLSAVLAFVVFCWSYSISHESVNPPIQPDRNPSEPEITASASESGDARRFDAWRVVRSISPMDSSSTVRLALDSDNQIRAWLGEKQPTLIIQCRERQSAVYVVTGTSASVESGRSNHTVRIRLDSSSPRTQYWVESTDNTALFAPNPIYFARQLSKARTLTFEFTPFNASPAVAVFDLNDLSSHLGSVAEACSWDAVDKAEGRTQAARAALRASIAPHVHLCQRESFAGKWCWTDPKDPLYYDEMTAFASKEEALSSAVDAAQRGYAFSSLP
jgi:hypothetical protein